MSLIRIFANLISLWITLTSWSPFIPLRIYFKYPIASSSETFFPFFFHKSSNSPSREEKIVLKRIRKYYNCIIPLQYRFGSLINRIFLISQHWDCYTGPVPLFQFQLVVQPNHCAHLIYFLECIWLQPSLSSFDPELKTPF